MTALEAQLPRGHVLQVTLVTGWKEAEGREEAQDRCRSLGFGFLRRCLESRWEEVAMRGDSRAQKPWSAEAAAALGLGPQQEDSGAGHLRRALRGALRGALGRGPFKRRLARLLGVLAGHLGGGSVNLRLNTDVSWSRDILGH